MKGHTYSSRLNKNVPFYCLLTCGVRRYHQAEVQNIFEFSGPGPVNVSAACPEPRLFSSFGQTVGGEKKKNSHQNIKICKHFKKRFD